jgi:hypothetical protein
MRTGVGTRAPTNERPSLESHSRLTTQDFLLRPGRGLLDLARNRRPPEARGYGTIHVHLPRSSPAPVSRADAFPALDGTRRLRAAPRLSAGPACGSARISVHAGVVQQRRRWWRKAKSLKINKRCNAGVARSGLQNRGLQVRFLPGLYRGTFQRIPARHRLITCRSSWGPAQLTQTRTKSSPRSR